MARPTTKQELIKASNEQFDKLWQLIDSIPEKERQGTFGFEDRDRNIRDILVHLYEWHQLLLKWIEANQNGNSQPFLPEQYNWKTYPNMNIEIWQRHQTTSYEDAEKMLKASHLQAMQLIETFSDEELFTKKYFSWTGTTSLGSYCVSATSSHYDWAIKKIRKHGKLIRVRG